MTADTLSLLAWLVPLLLLAGAVAGILAGLLGVGGGIVIVPALYHIFSYLDVADEVRMHLAVGTSLATIIPTGFRSARAHARRGSFDEELIRTWTPAMIIGVLLGTWGATLANFSVLTSVFAIVALLVALYMGFGNTDWRLGKALPGPVLRQPIAGSIGAVSAMMGIGGGTIGVPLMSLFGVPIHRAVGTASGFGMIIAVPATFGMMLGGWGKPELPPFSLGYVNWLGFLLIVPTTLLFVPLGAKLAHSLSQTGLRRAFAIFLGLTSIRMFTDIF
jgi:uncharacterized protein